VKIRHPPYAKEKRAEEEREKETLHGPTEDVLLRQGKRFREGGEEENA